MIGHVRQLVGSVNDFLKSMRRPVVGRLKPALSMDAMEALARDLPFKLTEELQELFNTINGTHVEVGDPLDDLHWIPGYYLLCLEDALIMYDTFKADPRWSPDWFPVLANGAGDFVIQRQPSKQLRFGPIWNFMIDEQEPWQEAASLTSWLGMTEECFRQKAYFVDSTGFLEADWRMEAQIRVKWNPELK